MGPGPSPLQQFRASLFTHRGDGLWARAAAAVATPTTGAAGTTGVHGGSSGGSNGDPQWVSEPALSARLALTVYTAGVLRHVQRALSQAHASDAQVRAGGGVMGGSDVGVMGGSHTF